MKLIYPDVQIIEQAPGIQGVYEAICKAAATCYKSKAKTGEDAKTFVDALIKNEHFAMLEFGTVYLKIPVEEWREDYHEWEFMFPEDASWVDTNCDGIFHYITTNLRHVIERGVGFDTMEKYWSEPEEPHRRRFTVLFTISIGTAREFARHRVFSFAQESTRYCNYSKKKFGNELTFIIPSWSHDCIPVDKYEPDDYVGNKDGFFAQACHWAEESYFAMLEWGATPQEAREVLPLATKTELCMCGFEGDWIHFFDLRMRGTTGKPHPDAEYIATELNSKFKEKGIEL